MTVFCCWVFCCGLVGFRVFRLFGFRFSLDLRPSLFDSRVFGLFFVYSCIRVFVYSVFFCLFVYSGFRPSDIEHRSSHITHHSSLIPHSSSCFSSQSSCLIAHVSQLKGQSSCLTAKISKLIANLYYSTKTLVVYSAVPRLAFNT